MKSQNTWNPLFINTVTISSFENLHSRSDTKLPSNLLFSLSLGIVKPSFKEGGFSTVDVRSERI